MFFEEKFIDGKMCYRTESGGNWFPYTVEMLSLKYLELSKKLQEAERDPIFQPYIGQIGTSTYPPPTADDYYEWTLYSQVTF